MTTNRFFSPNAFLVGSLVFIILCSFLLGTSARKASCQQSCPEGFADCYPPRDCETNLRCDIHNCGECGRECHICNAIPECFHGTCRIGSCLPGWADCNHDARDGCETDASSNPSNPCNVIITTPPPITTTTTTPPPITTTTTTAPPITTTTTTPAPVVCLVGFADCNNDGVCETYIEGDTTNCGSCGFVCPAGNLCCGGQCSSNCAGAPPIMTR
jgi:hypothetical protein